MTAKAREAFRDRFIDEVDPERRLPEAERLRRAEAARRAFYARLALRSAQARARRSKKSADGLTPGLIGRAAQENGTSDDG